MPSSTVSFASSSSPSSPSTFVSIPTDPDELLRRCTELSLILHHALRLDPRQGSQDQGLEIAIASSLKGASNTVAPILGPERANAVETDAGEGDLSLCDTFTPSLLLSLESSLAETLALTSGFRPFDAHRELDDDGPTTAQDIRDLQALNSELRIELHSLQQGIIEEQDALQLSLNSLLTSLTQLLSTLPVLLHSHHLTTTLPSTTSDLSLLLLKLSSLLPLRSRTTLSLSHPQLDASLTSLGEALERKIKRARKEGEKLEEEGRGWREALGQGGRGAERKGVGEKRFEELMREMEGIEREGAQVERDLRRLGVGARAAV